VNRKLLLIIIIVLALTVAVLAWLVFFRPTAAPPTNQPLAPTSPVVTNSEEPAASGDIIGEEPVNRNAPAAPADPALVVRVLAMSFAERYGTYSNDANFQNLRDLVSIITDSFRAELDNIITVGTGASPSYHGVISHAVLAEVQQMTDSSAAVKVTTQRQESFSRLGEPQLSYETLAVELEKVGNGWLVNKAEWEKQ